MPAKAAVLKPKEWCGQECAITSRVVHKCMTTRYHPMKPDFIEKLERILEQAIAAALEF
jgi:hypothetical protein